MPGSVVFDTAIGLMFVLLTASLVSSAVIEWLGNKLNKRGEYLLRGLREMLDIPPATPHEPAALGTRGTAGEHGLIVKEGRRTCLQNFSTKGDELRTQLASARQAEVAMPAPLADLVLSHPIIAALHRPTRPGRPARVRPTATVKGRRRGGRWTRNGRRGDRMHLASYVSAQAFTRSLLDLLVPGGVGRTTIDEIERQVQRLPDGVPAKDALLALLRDTGNDIDRFRRNVEHWYDEQMGRVSGWYKRWAQWRLLIAGAVLAVLVNVDSIAIAQTLYQDEPVRSAVVAQAVSAQGCPETPGAERDACLDRQQALLRDLPLPLGWGFDQAVTRCREYSGGEACLPHVENFVPFLWDAATRNGLDAILLKLLGWILTAVAVAFGAPFWFDALSKLGSLRTAGRRPGENAPYNLERAGSAEPSRAG
ncbi:MAG TPA: hypothetical protein VFB84_16815 [Micromonosporaceae bacterium]|nr:hypothetical protein [Micromonosporaceae bacterium]